MGSRTVLRRSALVMALAFTVHALNGLFIERAVLGLKSYTDYSVITKLDPAIGSIPWRASGVGHFLTAFAVLVLSVGLAERARDDGYAAWRLIAALGTVSAAGFAVNGVSASIGAQVVDLLQKYNPAEPTSSPIVALTLIVSVLNAVAITMFAGMLISVSVWARRTGALPRGLIITGWIAGISGLIMGFAYIPAYLFVYLVWLWWFVAVVPERRGATSTA